MQYAKNTTVSVEKSEAEIKGLLRKYGADQFMSGWRDREAVVAFRVHERFVRFTLTLPDRADKRFTTVKGRSWQKVDEKTAMARWEQACRQAWRALALVVKAKLEAVDAGISTFEQEFLAHIVVGDRTIGEVLIPKLGDLTSGRQRLLTAGGPEPGDIDGEVVEG